MPINPKEKSANPPARKSTRNRTGSISIPEDMQEIKDAKDGRDFLEGNLLLCPPGEPASNGNLSICLHQISAMPGIPRRVVNAIRAAAFLLEQTEELAINETVRSAFSSQIDEFESDMKLLIEHVNTKIDDHLKESLDQLAQAAAKVPTATNLGNAAVPGGPETNAARSYASALLNPPPHANPKIAAKEGIRARQFLLLGIKESAVSHFDAQKLKAELNKLICDAGLTNGKIRSVVIQKEGRTLLEVDSDEAA